MSTDFKKELDELCTSAHAAVEAALYQKTVKNSEVIDRKLRELVDALGRISEHKTYYCLSIFFCLVFQESWSQKWSSAESS